MTLFVEVLGDLRVVVEALDEVRFAIRVQIDELGELIAAKHEELSIAKLHAQRLKQSAGDASPRQCGGRFCHQAIHTPHIAIPHRDDGCFAIRREIEAAGAHPALKWIFNWQRKVIGDEGSVLFARHRGRGHGLRPLR